jgi:hypothetical protein
MHLLSFSPQKDGLANRRAVDPKAICFFVLMCRLSIVAEYVSKKIIAFVWLSGDEGIRTPGLRRAKAALSQLSYIPRWSWFREWA